MGGQPQCSTHKVTVVDNEHGIVPNFLGGNLPQHEKVTESIIAVQ
jgi:hypothetical protein